MQSAQHFGIFVLPFSIGGIILFAVLGIKYYSWIRDFSTSDKRRIIKGVLSAKFFAATKEVFLESLLHRKIFRVNPLLGYMHASLACGWFMLILLGTLEAVIHGNGTFHMPYEPVFYKFFNHDVSGLPYSSTFNFLMDFVLMIVLSGVALAFLKRFYSRLFGMKKTAKLRPFDTVVLISLWCIFPLRFLAESFTSGIYHNGGFLTGSAGKVFAGLLPLPALEYPAWWAYSIVLCIFFITLPFSRYMHIFTEVLLIYLRHFGLKTGKEFTSFSEIEVNSCPRCGICIDACQLMSATHIEGVQPVYFIKSIRENEVNADVAANCLLCGRCEEYCPVGIRTNAIRIAQREKLNKLENAYDYLNETKAQRAEVIYFAGCMTHLTSSIKKSMTKLLDKAKVNYWFMDAEGSVCCGKPLMIAGNLEAAKKLADYNKKVMNESGARLLVTSCPICYKTFKDDYALDMEIMHHTQYLLKLANENILSFNRINKTFAYHDPCELGRGSKIYDEPRTLLKSISVLAETQNEREDALCCGGSLGNINITSEQRDAIMQNTLESLTINKPDTIITACPLCKKTLAKKCTVRIADISEVCAEAIY